MAGRSRLDPRAPRELDRYLIDGEMIVFVLRRHWFVLIEPALTTIAATFLMTALVPRTDGVLTQIVLALWLAVLVRFGWRSFLRWHDVFLATDKRLMLVHGFLTRKVDIMPMSKVTDMRYDRSLTGQLFGFGEFILESAGQDQALSRINYIPDPNRHYQEISAIIFGSGQVRVPGPPQRAAGPQMPITEPDSPWWRRP